MLLRGTYVWGFILKGAFMFLLQQKLFVLFILSPTPRFDLIVLLGSIVWLFILCLMENGRRKGTMQHKVCTQGQSSIRQSVWLRFKQRGMRSTDTGSSSDIKLTTTDNGQAGWHQARARGRQSKEDNCCCERCVCVCACVCVCVCVCVRVCMLPKTVCVLCLKIVPIFYVCLPNESPS